MSRHSFPCIVFWERLTKKGQKNTGKTSYLIISGTKTGVKLIVIEALTVFQGFSCIEETKYDVDVSINNKQRYNKRHGKQVLCSSAGNNKVKLTLIF